MGHTPWLTVDGTSLVSSPRSALRITILFIFAALAGLALASACGVGMMGNDMRGQMHGRGSQAPQTPVISDAAQVTVEIINFDFFARDLTVQRGSTVTWVNGDAVPHDATDVDESWGTGTLAQGESATLTFDSPGAYQYLCTIHPTMKATLNVV